jgi:dTDP-4-amino-4,6-dideoxygalactose transaminase
MINFADPKKENNYFKKKIIKSISKVINSNQYILGKEVKDFENSFSSYIKSRYACGVSSGTDALILALKSLNIKKGDEIITTSHTAVATAAAIVEVGAKPVFADIDESYNIDINKLDKKINTKTKAIIAVHIYGNPVNIELLKNKIKKKIFIIEDCSQAHGSEIYEKKVGSIGDIGCFSLYPTKNLGCIGDGGILTTNNKKLYDNWKILREYGWKKKNFASIHGINNRLDEIQAAILNVKIQSIDMLINERISNANFYLSNIKNKNIVLPKIIGNAKHSFHLFVIRVLNNKRKLLIKKLRDSNINPGIHYPTPIHMQTAYKKYSNGDLKLTEKYAQQILSIPCYPFLEDRIKKKIINIINNLS